MRRGAALFAALLTACSGAQAAETCLAPAGLNQVDLAGAEAPLRLVADQGAVDVFVYDRAQTARVLHGTELVPWEGEYRPGTRGMGRPINTLDGRHIAATRTGRKSRVYELNRTTHDYELMFETDALRVTVDRASGRVLVQDGPELLEWQNGALQTSPLMLHTDGGEGAYAPNFRRLRYLPGLRSWMAMQGRDLWLRHDDATDWRHVDSVEYGPGRSGPPRLMTDAGRGLGVLEVGRVVLVFDIAGPRPEYLYQLVVNRAEQAGQGRVLVELRSPKGEAAWFEGASSLRIVTRDGAWPLPGNIFAESEAEAAAEAPRYVIQPLGQGLLLSSSGVVSGGPGYFDGVKLYALPGARAAFGNKPVTVSAMPTGPYLTGPPLFHWNEGDRMTPIVTENKTLPDEVVAIGSAVAFLRHDKAGDRLWLSRDGVNLIAVPTLQPDAPIDSFVAVPGRDALLIAQGETLAVASLCPDQPDPPESAPKGLPALDQRPE